MGKKINKFTGILAATFLICGLILIFYKRHQFLEDYKFTRGKVIDVTTPGYKSSGDYSIMYTFKVNGKTHFNNENLNLCGNLTRAKVKILIAGKDFPIAYSANDPGTCTILVTLENAERFHYIFSDSLKKYDSILTCK